VCLAAKKLAGGSGGCESQKILLIDIEVEIKKGVG